MSPLFVIVQANLTVSYEAALITADVCIEFPVLVSYVDDERLL